MTEEGWLDGDGNEIEVVTTLYADRLAMLSDFLAEYRREVDFHSRGGEEHYDMTDELPKRHGATKAQEVWNAIALGEELGWERARNGTGVRAV